MEKKILRLRFLKNVFILFSFVFALSGYSANEHVVVSKTGNQIANTSVLNVQDQWLSYMNTNTGKTGKTTIKITGKEDIIEKTYSIEVQNGIPTPVYTSVVNQRAELVEQIKVERPLESVYGLTWQTYDEEVAYKTVEDATNGKNGLYTDKYAGSRLAP